MRALDSGCYWSSKGNLFSHHKVLFEILTTNKHNPFRSTFLKITDDNSMPYSYFSYLNEHFLFLLFFIKQSFINQIELRTTI